MPLTRRMAIMYICAYHSDATKLEFCIIRSLFWRLYNKVKNKCKYLNLCKRVPRAIFTFMALTVCGVLFLEVLLHMVMWRGVPHTYQVCVWSLSLCRCVGAKACGASPGQIVYMYTIGLSMPGKRETLGRCWFNVGPRRIDGRPALIRHWFSVSCM